MIPPLRPGRSAGLLLLALPFAAGCGSATPPPEPPRPGEAEETGEARPGDDTRAGDDAAARDRRDLAAPWRGSGEPVVRVGLAVGGESVTAESPEGLRIVDPGSDRVLAAPGPEEPVRFTLRDRGVVLDGRRDAAGGASAPRERLILRSAGTGQQLELDGRTYRGEADLLSVPGHGLVVINRVALESYLLGVVSAEIGERGPDEAEAVKAQAVAARTYAFRNLGRRDSLGFDLFASVEDQVYGGREGERADATRAVRETAGEILTYEGEPIRAYYHSTGGGRTAAVSEVWHLEDAPYLRPVSDRRPGGGDYCDISPRYRWEETWTTEELEEALAGEWSAYFGLESPAGAEEPPTGRDRSREGAAAEGTDGGRAGGLGPVREIRVLGRSEGGRVSGLEVRTSDGSYRVLRNDIRFALRTPDGRSLRSTRFRIIEEPGTGEGLRLQGRGFGHGIGMCQWGAIGRARAGQSYREILSTYYPGTDLIRLY